LRLNGFVRNASTPRESACLRSAFCPFLVSIITGRCDQYTRFGGSWRTSGPEVLGMMMSRRSRLHVVSPRNASRVAAPSRPLLPTRNPMPGRAWSGSVGCGVSSSCHREPEGSGGTERRFRHKASQVTGARTLATSLFPRAVSARRHRKTYLWSGVKSRNERAFGLDTTPAWRVVFSFRAGLPTVGSSISPAESES